MLAQDISGLKTSYKAIDRIAKRFDDLWHEQLMQAEQMKRIEDRLKTVEDRLKTVEDRLKTVEDRLGSIENQLEELPAMKKLLLLICKKLGINPSL